MESPDLLQLASGDPAPAPPALKREQDSLDDFEHLERAPPAPAPADLLPGLAAPPAPLAPPSAAAAAQSFLDTEREELLVPAAAHLADKFTDSESEPEASDSPRRAAPQPPAPLAPTPAPAAPASTPAPPAPAPAPVAAPAPRPTEQPPAPPPKLPTEPPKLPTEPARAPQAHVIEAEVIFCQMGLDAWFKPERLHPKVESLIYWRDPARSGIALGAGLALLLALACCSVVSVLAYASLILLTGTVAFRIYKNILQAVQKTSDGHPFKWLLESDISLPAERSQEIAAAATAHTNAAAHELRRLFLVEDLIDSLKFGVVLWMFTYLGACFNGITLFILGYVALFTLPKAYEANKAQVDANLELARAKINEITAKVRAAVPLGKKSESEKDK